MNSTTYDPVKHDTKKIPKFLIIYTSQGRLTSSDASLLEFIDANIRNIDRFTKIDEVPEVTHTISRVHFDVLIKLGFNKVITQHDRIILTIFAFGEKMHGSDCYVLPKKLLSEKLIELFPQSLEAYIADVRQKFPCVGINKIRDSFAHDLYFKFAVRTPIQPSKCKILLADTKSKELCVFSPKKHLSIDDWRLLREFDIDAHPFDFNVRATLPSAKEKNNFPPLNVLSTLIALQVHVEGKWQI